MLSLSNAFFFLSRPGYTPLTRKFVSRSAHQQYAGFSGTRAFCQTTAISKNPPQFTHNKNLLETYNSAVTWLAGAGLDDAEDSARHLISHATSIGTRFSDFHNSHQRVMSDKELSTFASMCQQRANREPVQYIIGNWDFYGLTFQCEPPILIPRPETEELVENILRTNLLQSIKQPKILDVGAGTGAIGIALLSQLPHAQCCSVDINENAVHLARSNAKAILGDQSDRYSSYHSDFVSFVKNVLTRAESVRGDTNPYSTLPQFDLIVSNPPYIPSADIAHLQPEIKQFEDSVALDGGADGLDIVKDLIFLAPLLLAPTGTRELWLEVSEAHPDMVEEWLKSEYEFDKSIYYDKWVNGGGPEISNWSDVRPTFVSGIKDLVGNPRFIRLRF